MEIYSSGIEVRQGLDLDRINEVYPKAIESRREYLIASHMKQNAWEYLIKTYLAPMFADQEIVQSHLGSNMNNLYIDALLSTREEIDEWLALFSNDELWELYNQKADIAKRVSEDWKHGSYIRYNFHPTRQFTDELTRKFAGKWTYCDKETEFSAYQFSIYLDLYPLEDGDCQITNLGKVTRTYTEEVFEVTCGQGAAEMRELLEGSSE